MTTEALRRLKVIEVGSCVPSAYCARLLGDFGADVVKVEGTSTDADRMSAEGARLTAGDGETRDTDALSTFLNQNKRSVGVDLTTDRGRAIWRRLLAAGDVIIEYGSPGGLTNAGVEAADLREENPKMIVVSISPFGQEGPYEGRPACHLTVSALGGWLKLLGDPTREPVDIGFPALDYISAVVGCVGALAAWRAVSLGADGQSVDVSQQEVALRMFAYPTLAAKLHSVYRRSVPFPMYVRASDGYAAVNALSAQHWRDACNYAGLDDVAEDRVIANDHFARARAAPVLQARMDAWAADRSRDTIFHDGQALRIPAGIPYDLLEIVETDQYKQRKFFRPLTTAGGVVQQPVGPLGGTVVRSDWMDAPVPGEHTEAVIEKWLHEEQGRDPDEK